MPLTFANIGEEYIIKRIGGRPDVKKHLEDLGFTAGGLITIVSTTAGNLIIKVKESRIAINSDMAQKIIV